MNDARESIMTSEMHHNATIEDYCYHAQKPLSSHLEVQPTRRACPRGTVRDIGVEIRKLVGERV
jgi:hypothetical protein